jgi:hypothetical protein
MFIEWFSDRSSSSHQILVEENDSSFWDKSTDKQPFEPELAHELINAAIFLNCPRD